MPPGTKLDIEGSCVGKNSKKNTYMSRYKLKLQQEIIRSTLTLCDTRGCNCRLVLSIPKRQAEPKVFDAFTAGDDIPDIDEDLGFLDENFQDREDPKEDKHMESTFKEAVALLTDETLEILFFYHDRGGHWGFVNTFATLKTAKRPDKDDSYTVYVANKVIMIRDYIRNCHFCHQLKGKFVSRSHQTFKICLYDANKYAVMDYTAIPAAKLGVIYKSAINLLCFVDPFSRKLWV